ncbi:MAG: RraA family protein [Bradyrhizobiaceae bacterium]|nr:RraA family protein [Bradyrhizobiaceae bacterium]
MNVTSDPLTDRLVACYTGAVHDVLRAMGHPNCVLPPQIQGLQPGMRVVGRAFTVSGHIDNTLDHHETLLRWTKFLSRAEPGSVVLCQPNTDAVALMGELSAETLKLRGIRGYIVDGGCRDVSFILKMNFPVFCKFRTPADVVGRWTPDAFNVPITIGTVTVSPGDYTVADLDGVVIIPHAIASEVVERTEEVMRTENKVRTAIVAGMDPHEAYLQFGKF